MEYKRFGSKILVRIDKDEEILEKVKELALKEKIRLAAVQALLQHAAGDVLIIRLLEGFGDRQEEIGANIYSHLTLAPSIGAAALRPYSLAPPG